MNFYTRRFNLYLLAVLLAAAGCATDKDDKKKPMGGIRVHVETVESLPGRTSTVEILRSSPVSVVINGDPIVTEANVITARLLDTSDGGFAIRVRFDETGGIMLEQATAGNPGRHLAIFGQWGKTIADSRWLAAPLITRRIYDATLTFTPDASREEAMQMVDGLNRFAKKSATGKDE